MKYSFIIPVFNRPEEIKELLHSFSNLHFSREYEIVIIEDGSEVPCNEVVDEFADLLKISYLTKDNTGPGDSRNYGMQNATGNYFIILDSDCLLPPLYLNVVDDFLKSNFVDCFGGPDAAHDSFSSLQKSINFAMTATISTGGVRGGRGNLKDFQPRSFNMGISMRAFLETGGFKNIHPGEDPDLAIRIKKAGMKTTLIRDAYVFHKRRIGWSQFFTQVYKFGMVRPILNKWHPHTAKITFWLPTLFLLGLVGSIILAIFGIVWTLVIVIIYLCVVFVIALIKERRLKIALLSVLAVLIQFIGYGWGYLKSFFYVSILNRNPQKQFPKLFFNVE